MSAYRQRTRDLLRDWDALRIARIASSTSDLEMTLFNRCLQADALPSTIAADALGYATAQRERLLMLMPPPAREFVELNIRFSQLAKLLGQMNEAVDSQGQPARPFTWRNQFTNDAAMLQDHVLQSMLEPLILQLDAGQAHRVGFAPEHELQAILQRMRRTVEKFEDSLRASQQLEDLRNPAGAQQRRARLIRRSTP